MRCMLCFGLAKRPCPKCGKRKKILCDNCIIKEKVGCPICAAMIEHLDYLLFTWYKLKKYKMTTTKCETLDKEVRDVFGFWELPQPRLI